VCDVTPRTVSRWVDAGRLHLWEQPGNRYLICERSLEGVERGHQNVRRRRFRVGSKGRVEPSETAHNRTQGSDDRW